MGIMNCRGTATRQRIVKEYHVKPVAHIQLLAGQTKHSDAEAIILEEYYIFNAESKSDGKKEIIQCGLGAARDFLRILGIPGLPIFNPLKKESNNETVLKEKEKESKGNHSDKWNATARQLYNGIMWLIIAWDARPNTPLFEFKEDTLKYKNYDPFDWKIKRVNTVIKNGGKGKTLTEIVGDFQKRNQIKDNMCDFTLLKDRMTKILDEKGNRINSYF